MEDKTGVITRLYCGIRGLLVYGKKEYDEESLDGAELKKYEPQIRKALQKELDMESSSGLADYLDNQEVRDKIISAFPMIEVWKDKLWGVLEIKSKEPLQPEECSYLKQEWRGQITDGWGEGFVQRKIPCGKKEHLFVDFFWEWKYGILTQEELKGISQQTESNQQKGMMDLS